MAKKNYSFTTQTFNRCDNMHFMEIIDSFSNLTPITPWNDLKEGEVYHLPNILLYKRADFIIDEIFPSYARGIIKEQDKDKWTNYCIYKNEVRAKFMVRKMPLVGV